MMKLTLLAVLVYFSLQPVFAQQKTAAQSVIEAESKKQQVIDQISLARLAQERHREKVEELSALVEAAQADARRIFNGVIPPPEELSELIHVRRLALSALTMRLPPTRERADRLRQIQELTETVRRLQGVSVQYFQDANNNPNPVVARQEAIERSKAEYAPVAEKLATLYSAQRADELANAPESVEYLAARADLNRYILIEELPDTEKLLSNARKLLADDERAIAEGRARLMSIAEGSETNL
jgi:hypothetical protein